ncbi:MAG: glycosyltransferase [Myxococcales bacterium]|nr:glycosyltransferase [Myxococcales bacterium]
MLSELAQRRTDCEQCELETALSRAADRDEVWWLDSMYLDALPRLRARRKERPLWLLLHYLPSFVDGSVPGVDGGSVRIGHRERAALKLADGVLATSALMRDMALQFGARQAHSVEPGVSAGPSAAGHLGNPLRILVLANVTVGKGVRELLGALRPRIWSADSFLLTIVGDMRREPGYARGCRKLAEGTEALRHRVRFVGSLAPQEARVVLSASDLLVSASIFEAYGMACAEARAVGVPVLARRGGNTAVHVEACAGGESVDSSDALADALLSLVRAPHELRQRKRLALQQRRERPWRAAVDEWLAVFNP